MAFNQLWTQVYKIPTVNTGAAFSNSKLIDYQSGYEKTHTAMVSALSGANCIVLHGGVTAELAYNPLLAIINDDVANIVGRTIEGFDVNEDTMALDPRPAMARCELRRDRHGDAARPDRFAGLNKRQACTEALCCIAPHTRIADQDRFDLRSDACCGDGFDDDFRPDTRRVTHGDGKRHAAARGAAARHSRISTWWRLRSSSVSHF